MSWSRRLAVGVVAAVFTIGSMAALPPAHAAQGKVKISKWVLGISGTKCGTVTATFYNASSAPVLWVKVLVYSEQDLESGENRPYKRTDAKSWVKFDMYLKPGKSETFKKYLCSSLPPITGLNPEFGDWQKNRQFFPERLQWKWV